ncbi:MAG: 6-pyruvoyl tetrahydropterin synthase family protein [Phycisphaerales bacterium JB043]
MYELRIQREFCAAHSIMMCGVREPTHGHNWRVTVSIVADELDSDGLVCDFHTIEQQLDAILAPFQNANLNETPPFDAENPTAELVSRHIAQSLSGVMPDEARVRSVGVTEAPGCEAVYWAD